ncbi:MAG: glycosyltransferase family 2 protein [Mucilaginibacter sp.]|nr:glycosyltransferase family 2 protein [Mucilaginibacter sp.]
MKLSIILINHNSRNGLRLALTSLRKAAYNISHEIFVVDNDSTDKSLDMLYTEFQDVQLIANNKEEGLSKANNQALLQAKGEYVLLLSPDTIIGADFFEKLNKFMDEHPLSGGVSVRMVDFRGDYLQRSKHTLNGTWAAFFKLVGLSSYFPKTFSHTQRKADWVDEFETKEIDVLNETCMLLRRSVLRSTGLFDERFTRFGYNVDLSYRIRLQGFKNYYYSKTYIIQLPGKTVNKFSWDHIKHFYGAMFIFAAKYLFKLPVLNVKNIGELYPSSYEIE